MTEQDRLDLHNYIIAAFTPADISVLLSSQLNLEFDVITSAVDIADIATAVLDAAVSQGWTDRLVRALYENGRPHPGARAVFVRMGVVSDALQRLLDVQEPFLKVGAFQEALATAKARVFSIEIDGHHAGTAFLVGPDLGLTNFHVLEEFVDDQGHARSDAQARVMARFDYVRHDASDASNRIGLAQEWLVAHSRYHSLDRVAGEHDPALMTDALDYLLFRLSVAIGHTPSPHGPSQRGWYHLKSDLTDLEPEHRLILIQHPDGAELSLDDGRVSWINGNHTRVRYHVNTLPGSSGSPGLDVRMDAAVLHHSGDPRTATARYNQGIPTRTIAAKLRSERLGDLLTAPPGGPDVIAYVSKGEPVFDRGALQATAKNMCDPQGPRVLCVDGPAGTGRQYVSRIIEQVAFRFGQTCVPVEMAAFAGASPDQLCEVIALELSLDQTNRPPCPEDRQSARWSKMLVAWLIGQLRLAYQRDEVPSWIIFDCVGEFSLTEDLLEFIVELADRAHRTPQMRMVLIGADTLLPVRLYERAEKERTSPIVPQDLSGYLVNMAARNAVFLDPNDADTLAQRVFATLPSDGMERWDHLVRAALALTARIQQEGQHG